MSKHAISHTGDLVFPPKTLMINEWLNEREYIPYIKTYL